MNRFINSWWRFLFAEIALAAVLAVILLMLVVWASRHSDSAGKAAAGVAFAVCWLPNAFSLLIVAIFREPQYSVPAMLIGMLLRMGVPAVFAVALLQMHHWLVDAGVLPMVLAMYLVALVVETVLSLWVVGAFRPQVKAL